MSLSRIGRIVGLLVVLGFAPLASVAGTLSFVSEPDDPLVHGASLTENFDDSTLAIELTNDGLRVSRTDLPEFWSLDLSSTTNHPIAPACYERAQRDSFREPNRPGLDFGFGGSGCGSVAGRFDLIDLKIEQGVVTSLAVDFVQHCESVPAALWGKLRYNTDVPLDTPTLAPVYETNGLLAFSSDAGDYIGAGRQRIFPFHRLQNSILLYTDNTLEVYYHDHAPVYDAWTLHLAAPDAAPLAAASYADAERWPFQTPGHPGLSYDFAGTGCNTVSGGFDIDQIHYDPLDGVPDRLNARFVQHCNEIEPALTGHVRYETTFQNGPRMDDSILIGGFDDTTDWPLIWNCH